MKLYKVFYTWEYLLTLLYIIIFVFTVYYKLSDPSYKAFVLLKKQQAKQAEPLLKQALKREPYDFEAQINLAFTYDLLKQYEKSLQVYLATPQFAPNKLRFYSYFNQGELYGRLQDVGPALKSYQKALNFVDFHTLKVKKNIEWLFKEQKPDSSKDPKKEKPKDSSQQEGKAQEGDSSKTKGESQKKDSQEEDSQKGETQKEESQKGNQKEGESQEESDSQEESQKGESSQAEGSQGGSSTTSPFQESPKEFMPSGSKQQDTTSKGLTKREEQAIREEVEQQENRVRSQFYKGKKTFGDKTDKDW